MAIKNTNQMSQHAPLFRSETNRMIAGVAGGLGEYLNVDPTIIRLIFVLLVILGGSSILMYLILWIIIPTESQVHELPSVHIHNTVEEIKAKAKGITGLNFSKNSLSWWAILLIALGIFFLMNNFGLYTLDFGKLWPVWLIIFGVILLLRRK